MDENTQEQIINQEEEVKLEPWEEEQVLKGNPIGELEPMNLVGLLISRYKNDPAKIDSFTYDLTSFPEPVQNFLFSGEVFLELKNIGSSAGLNPDQTGKLLSLTSDIIIGNQFVGDFVNSLKGTLSLDDQKSKLLADTISASLFSQIANDLKKVQQKKFGSKIDELRKVAPQTQKESDPIISSQSGFSKPGGPANIQGPGPQFQTPKPTPPPQSQPPRPQPINPIQQQPSQPVSRPQPVQPIQPQRPPSPTPQQFQVPRPTGPSIPPQQERPVSPTPTQPRPPIPTLSPKPEQQGQRSSISPPSQPAWDKSGQNPSQPPVSPRPGQDVNQPRGTVKVIDLSQLGK